MNSSKLFAIGSIVGLLPLAFEIDSGTIILLNLLWLPTILSFLLIIFTIIIWIKGYFKITQRIHYTIVTISAFGLIFWLNYWNILGYRI